MAHNYNILLDLDQTIISGEDYSEFSYEENQRKADRFKHHDMENCYMIFERPGLQQFLDFLFDNGFKVSVWTAASKSYALFIVDNVILPVDDNGNRKYPNRNLEYVFFSYHCDISKKMGKGSKDLSILWDRMKLKGMTPKNTIILDDYIEVYETQPGNCVRVIPFEFLEHSSHNDNFFEELQVDLLELASKKPKANPAKKINKNLWGE